MKHCGRLPAAPGVVVELLRVAKRPEASMRDVSDIIGRDSLLAAKFLRFVNSPMAGLSHEVRSVPHAVSLLGMWGSSVLALSFAALSSEHQIRCPGFDMSEYRRQSLGCSVSAKILADVTGVVPPDEAFAVGLLSQIGRMVFALGMPTRYAKVLESVRCVPADLPEAEMAEFGATYATIGAQLLADWDISETMVTPIATFRSLHTTPNPSPMAKVLCLAELATQIICASQPLSDNQIDQYLRAGKAHFEIGAEKLVSLLGEMAGELELARECLELPRGDHRQPEEIDNEARARVAEFAASLAAALSPEP